VNAVYRLGDELLVRLPRREAWVHGLETERVWLPVLAGRLPVPIPEPVAFGVPGEGFPLPWAVYRWVDGTPMLDAAYVDERGLAEDLAALVLALQRVEPSPSDRVPVGARGVPLAERDEAVRERIPELAGEVDTDAVTAAWEHALAAPVWDGPPVFMHGDLMPTNLLLRDGRLAGVLDIWVRDDGGAGLDISLSTPFQDQGIGRRAMRLGVELANARGHARVTTDPEPANLRAIRCYSSVEGLEVIPTARPPGV
jgi:aminoglycoside phosphotransferase (APT) family kinase protein